MGAERAASHGLVGVLAWAGALTWAGGRVLGAALVALVAWAPWSPAEPVPEEGPAPWRFHHLTADDGLSNSWVRASLRDRRGFLWISTLGGLDRYDGGSFVHYDPKPDDPHSLAAPDVRGLLEDRQGRLWVAAGALHLYDRDRDRFERHVLARAPGATGPQEIRTLCEDARGRLWLGTNGEGLISYDPETRQSRRFGPDSSVPGSLASGEVIGLLVDRRGRLWVGTHRGLDRFDESSASFVHVFDNRPDLSLDLRRALDLGLWVESLHEDQAGTLWVGSLGGGLIRFDPETGAVRHFMPDARDPSSLGGDRVSAITSDSAGRLYVGLENVGLDVLEPGAQGFTHYRPDREDPTSLGSTSIWSLSFDAQGILWIGTYNAGLDYLSPFGHPFGLLRARAGGLSDPHVMAVLEDRRGDLWIGTDGGGLNRLDRRTGRLRYYRKGLDGLASDAVLSLLEDRRGQIWFGTWAGGLHRLNPETGRVDRFLRGPDRQRSLAEWALFEDRQGRLLVAMFDGLDLLDPASGRYTPLTSLYPGVPDRSQVQVIVEDSRRTLWFGGQLGLHNLDPETGRVRHYPPEPGNPKALVWGHVYALLFDSRGNLWVGSESGGLACLEAATGAVRHYGRDEGLPNDSVGDILEDELGHLWLSTRRGLAKFEQAVHLPAQPTFLLYDSKDGLQGSEFRHGAAYRSRSGEMFFGGQRGLNYFRPQRVIKNPTPPPVAFTALSLFGDPAGIGRPGSPLERSITETRSLVLSHRHSVVSFEFAAFNFVLPAKNKYEYMLEGFEPRWRRASGQRTANYMNLAPGDYTLRVRAANNDGVWNETGAALRIRVTPPFWATPLFRLALVLFGAALVLLAHRWRVHRMQRHAVLLARLVDERTSELNREMAERVRLNEHLASTAAEVTEANRELEAFAYSVSHDLRAPLRAIDGFSQVLGDEFNSRLGDEGRRLIGLVRGNTQRMAKLIDDLLEFSRLGRKDLTRTNVDLHELVGSIWDEWRHQGLALPVLALRPLEPANCDPRMMRQVLVNLLSNAVKFSRPVAAPKVEVGCSVLGGVNVYYVKDNGVGFDMQYADKLFGVFQRLHGSDEFEGTGVGLAIVERVIRRHGGRVWGESTALGGATFQFTLPRPEPGAE